MTPDQRARNSAQKWLKISCQEMLRISKDLVLAMKQSDEEGPSPAAVDRIIEDLRKQAERCSHHGLGISVQQLLPLKPKE